jgi:RNA polymerase sigma factor (sigma-70 family)
MSFVRSYFALRSRSLSLAPPQQSQTPAKDLPHPDIVLVAACLSGDASAWDRLIEKYGGLVYSIARAYTLTSQDADDVFQNVFAIVLKSLPDLKQEQSLAPWLGTIARREAQRLNHKTKRWVALDDDFEDSAAHPLEAIHRQFLRNQVQLALSQLDPPVREFLLACMQDPPPTYQELAERFQMPLGSIGPTRGRYLKKLKSILARMGISHLD